MSTLSVRTGGASGADAYWAHKAANCGCKVEIVSFRGHRHAELPQGAEIVNISTEMLLSIRPIIQKACAARDQSMPRDSYTYNLVARNYFILSDALFGVGYLDADYKIEGGTGWSFQYTIGDGCCDNLFFFDLYSNHWFTYRDDKWHQIEFDELPNLTKFTRIGLVGSRNITETGKRAIDRLWAEKF